MLKLPIFVVVYIQSLHDSHALAHNYQPSSRNVESCVMMEEKEMNEAKTQLNQNIIEALQLNNKCTNPLIFIAGDFNGANTSLINRTHATYQINKKATRKNKLLDPIFTNAPKCYHCINQPSLANSDHQIVKAIPFNQD